VTRIAAFLRPALGAAGLALALGLVLAAAGPAAAQVAYRVRITNNNLVGLTTTNYGFFGNNFVSRSASFEYPLGSGYEHLVRGGLWIGGLTQFSGTGEELRVSTAAVDGSQGSASASGAKWTAWRRSGRTPPREPHRWRWLRCRR